MNYLVWNVERFQKVDCHLMNHLKKVIKMGLHINKVNQIISEFIAYFLICWNIFHERTTILLAYHYEGSCGKVDNLDTQKLPHFSIYEAENQVRRGN